MTHHVLKCWPHSFEAIHEGRKTFEIRKADRDFHEGDGLTLREYDPGREPGGPYTGRTMNLTIGYLVANVAPGFVAFELTTPGRNLYSIPCWSWPR